MVIEEPLVPSGLATIQSVKCMSCSWEATFIVPEESARMIGDLFWHISKAHGISIPTFLVHCY